MASTVAAWPTAPLGEVLTEVSRIESVQPDKEYRLLGIRLDGNGPFLRETKSGAQIAATSLSRVEAGDFIYSRLFAWRGAFGTIDAALDGCYVSGEFPTFRPILGRLDIEFLRLWFRLPSTLATVEADCTGSTPLTRNRFKELFFLAMQIPLPLLDEQRRIVAHIEALAARIEQARGLRRETMAETQHLWESGARALIEQSRRQFSPLRALVTVQGGGTPSKANPLFWEGDIPWVSPKDMKVAEIVDAIDHINEIALAQSAARLIEPGAVLVVTRGMILAHTVPTAILREPAAINQDMKALIPGDSISAEYLCATLRAYNKELVALVDRSSHDTRKLETPKLLAFPLPVPSREEQQRLVQGFRELQTHVDSLSQLQAGVYAELDALLPSVLDQAFRGEL